jgi:predicted AAA+ superfamily ATPase
MWIKRDFNKIWQRQGAQPVRIILGPRQSGKSSFLHRMAETGRSIVDLDDLSTRQMAQQDPRTFLDQLPSSLVIDEAQYAPNLFPEIKFRVDKQKRAMQSEEPSRPTLSYWLTGSNRILLDQEVAESLTGRATYYFFHNLSLGEIVDAFGKVPFGEYLLKGGWPELWSNRTLDSVSYLNDHIQTTLAKDLVQTAKISKVNEFLKVLKLVAGRIGNLFVASEVARDAGVKSETVSDWVSFIERMMYLIEVPAFSTSLTTRLIKSSKYFFSDVAIACRLQGWTAAEPILVSPYLGFIFENAVASEIVKVRDANRAEWSLSHWRTKEMEEVDFIISTPTKTLALECKYSAQEAMDWQPPKEIRKLKHAEFVVVSLSGGRQHHGLPHISLYELRDFLLENLK